MTTWYVTNGLERVWKCHLKQYGESLWLQRLKVLDNNIHSKSEAHYFFWEEQTIKVNAMCDAHYSAPFIDVSFDHQGKSKIPKTDTTLESLKVVS